jgi:pilus assembly protein CpaE
MNNPLNVFVALDQTVDRQVVETILTSSAKVSVANYGDLDDRGPDSGGDVVVVACGHYTSEVAEYIAHASSLRAGRPVILLAPVNGNGYVSDAFGHGADDVVSLPLDDGMDAAVRRAPELVFALEKAVARKRGTALAVAQGLGEMIVVLGLKGGSGKTLTCVNLAVALADAGRRVAVVDLDLQFGDIGLALGLKPERTIYDLVRAGGSLDAEKLADFMVVHPSGVRALLAPTRPDQAASVTKEFLSEVYRVLRETSDFVIVDTPPSFTPEVIAAVDSSTALCVVAMLDSLSLKNTKLGFETLQLMEYDDSKVQLVLNRADSDVGIPSDAVGTIIGRTPSISVPSDRNVALSVNRGEPIALAGRDSETARAFHALAGSYLGNGDGVTPVSTPRRRRRRLFWRG